MSGILNRAVNARISDGHGRSWANAATVGETPEIIYFSFDCGAPGVVAGVPVELRPSTVRGISDNRQINLSQYGNFLPIRHTDRISFVNSNGAVATPGPTALSYRAFLFNGDGTLFANGNLAAAGPVTIAGSASAPSFCLTLTTVGGLNVGSATVPASSEPIPSSGGGWVCPVVVTPTAADIANARVYTVEVYIDQNGGIGVNV